MKASDIQFTKETGFLLKGPPGFGKTIAAVSAAIYGPVYLAYIDKRAPVEVLAFYKKHRPEILDNLEWDCYGSSNINEYLNKLVKFTTDCRYVAVITDGVTSATSAAVNWSMGFREKKDSSSNRRGRSDTNEASQLTPVWDDYKVETALITQALDICKTLPVMNIWTAHPLATIKLEGSGTNIDSVTKTSSLVSYGTKVGSLIPGAFQEIYHFGSQAGKRVVFTNMLGEDYAKTVFNIPKMLDISDKLFFEVWRDAVNKGMEEYNNEATVKVPGQVTGNPKWKV